MERTKAFSDGVLAIVITLLVLGLEVPDHDFDRDGLVDFLRKIGHEMHPFVGSFALISAYWVQHTVIFHYVRLGSRRLVWTNLLFLFVLSPMPFLTDLRATYRHEPVVIALFGVAQVLCGLLLLALWRGARGGGVDAVTYRSMRTRILLGPLIVVIASLAGLIGPILATAIFLCMPLLYVSHRQVDEHWQDLPPDGEGAGA
jgi:uncharacterized membrane protein